MTQFLQTLRTYIDCLNENVGRAVAWLALALVLTQFTVVILRYVFSIGFIWMQEMVWYCHGLLFMLGAGYTLLHNAHVRVDIFYGEATPNRKALIDFLGSIFLLIPLCVFTLWLSWGYVIHAWDIFEGSTEADGLPLIFLFKTVIWLFAILLALQGISLAIKAWLQMTGIEETYGMQLEKEPAKAG